jgi:hypothetical protein
MVTTAMAYVGLSAALPLSKEWEKCRDYILKEQQHDGTWRYGGGRKREERTEEGREEFGR